MNQPRTNRRWAYAIGTGMAIAPVHNVWLTDLASNSKGEVIFFLPAFGFLIWIMGTGLYLLHHWDEVREAGCGDKRVVILLSVIVGAIALSGINAEGWAKFAPLGAGASMFALYIAGRKLGNDLFLPLAVGSAVASLGIIVSALLRPGLTTGGLVFEGNFDIATGYILLGSFLFVHRWRWLLVGLGVSALIISGAPEAFFAIGVVGVVFLFRRDWSRRVLVFAPVVAGIALLLVLGYGTLFQYTMQTLGDVATVQPQPRIGLTNGVSPIALRLFVIKLAMSKLTILGDGYNITGYTVATVHNVPLVIVQQLGWFGILAGLAWLGVTVYCLVKTKYIYVWVLVLALSVFDHYMWTQLGTWWWAIAGVSLANKQGKDLVFRT